MKKRLRVGDEEELLREEEITEERTDEGRKEEEKTKVSSAGETIPNEWFPWLRYFTCDFFPSSMQRWKRKREMNYRTYYISERRGADLPLNVSLVNSELQFTLNLTLIILFLVPLVHVLLQLHAHPFIYLFVCQSTKPQIIRLSRRMLSTPSPSSQNVRRLRKVLGIWHLRPHAAHGAWQ